LSADRFGIGKKKEELPNEMEEPLDSSENN
jgi:hypothetical protein